MTKDVLIYPSQEELRLLKSKAQQKGMSVEQYVSWLLRQAITKTDTQLRHIVYS